MYIYTHSKFSTCYTCQKMFCSNDFLKALFINFFDLKYQMFTFHWIYQYVPFTPDKPNREYPNECSPSCGISPEPTVLEKTFGLKNRKSTGLHQTISSRLNVSWTKWPYDEAFRKRYCIRHSSICRSKHTMLELLYTILRKTCSYAQSHTHLF